VNKPMVGIAAGAVLGIIDGATAWFTPAARPLMTSILIGSCVKGMVVGVLSGIFARKVHSNGAGIAVGAALGLLFAYIVAAMPSATGEHYYLEIMLPGFVVGAIIGFLTQRLGENHAKTNPL
jgi:small basic protein